jgi:molybdate transport system ATP-binding protein
VEGIAVRDGRREVFAGTSFTLREGEHWALLGPNGSGKSTLAAALCGHIPLSAGAIHYRFLTEEEARDARFGWFPRGKVVRVGGDDRRRLADRYSPYVQARWNSSESGTGDTVADLLERQAVEALNPYEVLPPAPEAEVRAYEARRARVVELLGLGPLLGRRVLQLSNGETQKLLLARAVLRAPRLLVLDDPFAGLDRGARETLRGALDELGRAGMQLVVATPRPEDLPACVDRVLLVRDHRVVGTRRRSELGEVRWDEEVAVPTARHPVRPEPFDSGPASPALRSGQAESKGERMRRGAPLVELADVTVRYGATTILDRVSFRLRRGEHWAISGPNGAGKSTLLSLVLGDNPQAYANRVRLFGRQRGTGESIWDLKARIGAVSPELHAHYPTGTRVLDAVCSGLFGSVGLYQQCKEEDRARARAWLERFGVPADEDRTLGELSYGLQRLVLVARALVSAPELLVLDEPCQGLDGAGRRRVIEAADAAAEASPVGILFVTHRADEIPRCITHALQLERGRVVRAGPRR